MAAIPAWAKRQIAYEKSDAGKKAAKADKDRAKKAEEGLAAHRTERAADDSDEG